MTQLVKLVSMTQPTISMEPTRALMSPEQFIAYCARVSNPSNQNNDDYTKLLGYCITNKHWSVFEQVDLTFEINTTRDIARQILRHRSFCFQEFCVHEDTKIYVDYGWDVNTLHSAPRIVTPIKELYDIQKKEGKKSLPWVWVYDHGKQQVILRDIKEVFETGIKPVYEVVLANGKTIKATEDHKLFLWKEASFVPIKNIQVGQEVGWFEFGYWDNKLDGSSVVSIEYIGEFQTYDLEVDHEEHNYVANGIITHNSQRYADPSQLGFQTRKARLQDAKNRQNSIDVADEDLIQTWEAKQQQIIHEVTLAYKWAIENGVAKEQARAVLPEGCTNSRLYMKGNLRSWITYIALREKNGTQKEHQEVAKEIKRVVCDKFPYTTSALGGYNGPWVV